MDIRINGRIGKKEMVNLANEFGPGVVKFIEKHADTLQVYDDDTVETGSVITLEGGGTYYYCGVHAEGYDGKFVGWLFSTYDGNRWSDVAIPNGGSKTTMERLIGKKIEKITDMIDFVRKD